MVLQVCVGGSPGPPECGCILKPKKQSTSSVVEETQVSGSDRHSFSLGFGSYWVCALG